MPPDAHPDARPDALPTDPADLPPERWAAWGATRPPLPRAAARYLRDALGPLTPLPTAAPASVTLPPSRLDPAARARLVSVLGERAVRDDPAARLAHAGGQGYLDLLARRRGEPASTDLVVTPGTAAEVAEVLAICSEERLAVVPYGGGTSVVGGLDPLAGGMRAVLTLSLARLDRVLDVDATDLLATVQPGIRTPALEAALGRHGLTLGHLPQSYERASVGGYVVTRSAGQASTGHGRIDDLVAGLRLATPAGELVLPAQPASAAGPDLRRLVLGSEGTLGVVTEVTLRVRPVPAVRRFTGWMLPDWAGGLEAMRALGQARARPDVTRLSDPEETAAGLALTGPTGAVRRLLAGYLSARGVRDGCLVILGFDGDADDVRHRGSVAARILHRAGGVRLGAPAGRSWEHGRFSAPYLRDTLLDAGVLVETLETAATWSALPGLYAALRAALDTSLRAGGRAPIVGCHVSHLYPAGASLYVTVLAARDPDDPVGQWAAAKRAAGDAIAAAGGTITHHHAVGTAHAPWLAAEVGEVGLTALRAVRRALDPVGILNPGKLLP